MSVEKIEVDGVWAETGDKESTLTSAKKAIGWTGADNPTTDRLNYLQNRIEEKIDELIRERVNSFYDDAASHQDMLSTGLWTDGWGCSADTANAIASGGTKEIIGLGVYFTSTGESRLLAADNSLLKFEAWDPRALTLSDTSDAMTDDLPTGGTEDWEIYSMCTDGTSVYGMFRDVDAAPDEHHVQAWDIATWDVKSGWPATGTALTGTGNGPFPTIEPDGHIIMASATMLACVLSSVVITADTDEAITIVDISDGTIASEGAGDCLTANQQAVGRPASDGTNIFFGGYKAATNSVICSATIADATAGCGGANYPLSTGESNKFTNAVSCGENLIVSMIYAPAAGSEDIVLWAHNATDADLHQVMQGIRQTTVLVESDDVIADRCTNGCFDGINLWIQTRIGNFAGTAGNNALVKIDVSKFPLIDTDVETSLPDMLTGVYITDPEVDHDGGSLDGQQMVVFDGRDMWTVTDSRASQTSSGKIFRLPLAMLRS